MKLFLKKISIILGVSAFIIIIIVWILCREERQNFLFVSNSVAYNARATHALKSPKFKNAQLLLIGSSMTQDNISAALLEDSLKLITYSFSSWGMKLEDLIDIVQQRDGYIYMNMSFIDLGKSSRDKKYGYPLNQNQFLIELNAIEDFQTFKDHMSTFRTYTSNSRSDQKPMLDLRFDSNGSVLFEKNKNFHMTSNIKNDTLPYIYKGDEDRFISDLGKIIQNNPKAHIIISFSPSRQFLYNKNTSIQVVSFFNDVKTTYKSVHCLDNYDLQYSDSLFVDNCHFNVVGAILYSKLIAKEFQLIKNENY